VSTYETVEHALLRNERVQERYAVLMRNGKPASEALFRVVREECERYFEAGQRAPRHSCTDYNDDA
jgi:hypothetical protein